MSALGRFLTFVRTSGIRRETAVETVAMGRTRTFDAYDIGEDTIILQRGISAHLKERPSVLTVPKADLRAKARGRVLTITTGNHSVAALPLLDGRFWGLSTLPAAHRSEVLAYKILCANVVGDTIEISQRDVATERLAEADNWLRGTAGFTLADIVMADRNVATLDHYKRLGQEWRVKPLAWTEAGIRAALAASRKRIASRLRYYHSARGVHFLSFSDFRRFADLAASAPEEFEKGLRELVSLYEGNRESFTRMPKYRGHHEIEFFGLKRGVAIQKLVPELEKLMERIALGRIAQEEIVQRIGEIVALYSSLLTRPEFADDTTREFADSLYMYITCEIYSVEGEGSTPAFDDRRTALPGATFLNGKAQMHPGSDRRTEILIAHLCHRLVSTEEIVEYANVYELRTKGEDVALGQGNTREIIYKTNRRPLERSLVVKSLAQAAKGYGSYMLSRVEALKALGVSLSDYRLLRHPGLHGQASDDFYVRQRCEGTPLGTVPATYFRNAVDSSAEEPEVVLRLAMLMGDAAAQNMAMKKYDPNGGSPLYDVGKEIYGFAYDVGARRIMPQSVSICSVRGSFGWPSLSRGDDNLHDLGSFYLQHYAHALKAFQRKHCVAMAPLAERFMAGFEARTRAMAWKLSVFRDNFLAFKPGLPKSYGFDEKWKFAMWSLERQERRVEVLRRMFFEKVKVIEDESVRNNPQ